MSAALSGLGGGEHDAREDDQHCDQPHQPCHLHVSHRSHHVESLGVHALGRHAQLHQRRLRRVHHRIGSADEELKADTEKACTCRPFP
jgi:hypothetical protein